MRSQARSFALASLTLVIVACGGGDEADTQPSLTVTSGGAPSSGGASGATSSGGAVGKGGGLAMSGGAAGAVAKGGGGGAAAGAGGAGGGAVGGSASGGAGPGGGSGGPSGGAPGGGSGGASGGPSGGAGGMVTQAPTRIAVIGDYGADTTGEKQVAAMVDGWAPALVATLGDNNYSDGAASTIDRNIGKHYAKYIHPYKGEYGPGADENRFFPCPGNHDWNLGNLDAYLDYFELPGNERYYDIVRGPVHLFFVDSDSHEPDGAELGSAQAAWLHAHLATSTSPYRVVLFHHPPYSSGEHGNSTRMQWPFKDWGASLVLSGHDHTYERIEEGGMTYVVQGLGGASLYTVGALQPGSVVAFNKAHGASLLTATDEVLKLESYAVGGDLIDVVLVPASGNQALSLVEPLLGLSLPRRRRRAGGLRGARLRRQRLEERRGRARLWRWRRGDHDRLRARRTEQAHGRLFQARIHGAGGADRGGHAGGEARRWRGGLPERRRGAARQHARGGRDADDRGALDHRLVRRALARGARARPGAHRAWEERHRRPGAPGRTDQL